MSVPKPWTNIVINESENNFTVEVWGRKYTFNGSIFPSSIISQDEELLFSPMKLSLFFGNIPKDIYNCKYVVTKSSDEQVTVNCAALCENLVINSAITIEYDGYIDCKFNCVPFGVWNVISDKKDGEYAKLSKASVIVQMNKKTASLLHYWPNGKDSVRTEPYVVPSGEFKEMSLPFKPCLWIGNENCGLNICMESDENIETKEPCINTRVKDDYNEVEITLLDNTPKLWQNRDEDYVMPMEPICYDVIFHATPVKRIDEEFENDWKPYHINNYDVDFEKVAKLGAKWVIFHESWTMIQNYCKPFDEKGLIESVKKCHSLGMKTMVYFGYEYSTAMEEWQKNSNNYCNKNEKGNFTGGWTRQNLYQKDFIVCYKSGYSDEMLQSVRNVMDKYGIDGIYTDQTYVPWGCANEKHDCGYRYADGNMHITYPIKAVREHVKKLFKEVHMRGGIVDAHQSSCCLMPTLSFCDSYYDGENLQERLSENLEEFLDMEAFRCEFMGRNYGLVSNFVTALKPPEYDMRNLLSITLIHNVIARPINMEYLEIVAKIWKSKEALDMKGASWKPYWEENSSVKTADKNVYISSFEKDDKILAFVSQFDSREKEIEITLPKQFKKAVEMFDNQMLAINNEVLRCKLKNKTAYMILIEK